MFGEVVSSLVSSPFGLVLLLAVVAGVLYKSLKMAVKIAAVAFVSAMFPLVVNLAAGFPAVPVTGGSILYFSACGAGLFLIYHFSQGFYKISKTLGHIVAYPFIAVYHMVEAFLRIFETDKERMVREAMSR